MLTLSTSCPVSCSYLSSYSVERFAEEMDTLLEITLRSSLVEKLSMALYDCLFEDDDDSAGNSIASESKVGLKV